MGKMSRQHFPDMEQRKRQWLTVVHVQIPYTFSCRVLRFLHSCQK